MSAVPKDKDHTAEYVEAIFSQVDGHPAPSVPVNLVSAVVMDSPNVNKAAMKVLAEKYPSIAFLPCAFHALDNFFGKLVKNVELLDRARHCAKRLTKFASSKSRVRAALQRLAAKQARRRSRAAGKKCHAVFYVTVRKSRHYPVMRQVKRAYQMNLPAFLYFRTDEAKNVCAPFKHWDAVHRIAVRRRAAFVQLAKFFLAILKPVMRKLRLVDAASATLPHLLLHLIDLRHDLIAAFQNMGYSYRLMRAKDDVDVEEALKQDLKKTVGLYNDMAKGLMSNWTVAAFLADPFHVIKYREEVRERGTMRLEAKCEGKHWFQGVETTSSCQEPALFNFHDLFLQEAHEVIRALF